MATTKWAMDPTHSEIQFKIRHLMITNVSGAIGKFSAEVETNEQQIESAKIKFTAEIDSITTNNEQRDTHLKSPDFFDAANYPTLQFVGSSLEKISADEYKMTGDLTIRGTTKKISLKVEHGGIITDPWGNIRTGFTIDGKLNRKEFGLTWNATTEAGGLVVGDEVKIHANVEFIKQA